jgi:hypothetical protein
MVMRKETIKSKSCKLLLDSFHFVGISRHNRVANNRGIFKLRFNEGEIIVDIQRTRGRRLSSELGPAI